MQCFDFFPTRECHWHSNKFLLDFRRNSIFQWKTSWSKIFWLAESGTEVEGERRRRNWCGFLLESFCSVLLCPSLDLWDRRGAGNGTRTATHSQEHPLTELQSPTDMLCSSLCWGTNPDSNPEISGIISPLWKNKSCSAWLRGSRSWTPVCPCPFQAHSDLVLWSTDQFYQHSQNIGISLIVINKWLPLSQIRVFFPIKILWSKRGSFHSVVFTWKTQGLWNLHFLATQQVQHWTASLSPEMSYCWWKAEQQILSPRSLLDRGSGQCLISVSLIFVPAEAAEGCRWTESLIFGNFWSGEKKIKKWLSKNSSPLDVHGISGVFLPWGIFNSLTLHFKAQLYWVPAQGLVNLE